MLTSRWLTESRYSGPYRFGLRCEEAHEQWGILLSRFPWQWFVTGTFDQGRFDSVPRDLARREGERWCQDASRTYRRPLGWVIAPERGRSGHWHVHMLLVGVPRLGGGSSPLRAARSIWEERNGHMDVRPVFSVVGVSLYVSKENALTGELEFSDTLRRYLRDPGEGRAVTLYQCEPGESISRNADERLARQ